MCVVAGHGLPRGLQPRSSMNRLIVEPLGVEIIKSLSLYAQFATNKLFCWESLQLFSGPGGSLFRWLGYDAFAGPR
jgi:hypothetical protein